MPDEYWLRRGLPTFDGGKDRQVTRVMLDRMGGPSGFKTSVRQLSETEEEM